MKTWLDNNRYLNPGYKDNPFRKLTFAEFCKAFTSDPLLVQQILKFPRNIYQFIGDSGCGKTSHLFLLYHHFAESGLNVVYHHISDNGFIPDLFLFCTDIIFLDEVNLADRRQLSDLTDTAVKNGVILIIGTHNDLSDYMPTNTQIDTFYLKTLLPEKLRTILQDSLRFSAADKPQHSFSEKAIKALLDISGCCMEKIRSICYDIFLCRDIPSVIDEDIIITTASGLRETHVDHSEYGRTSGPSSLSI